MEKEKQIEEMVEIAYNAICIQIGGGDFVDPGDRHAAAEIVSEDLYKAGYGNVKEAVKEFAEGLIKNGVYSCKCSTVKEVAENLVEQFENHIKKYAKEYGVEVEE